MKINFGKLSKWIVFWIKKEEKSFFPYNNSVSAEKLDLENDTTAKKSFRNIRKLYRNKYN